MPSTEVIVASLTGIAHQWRTLAIAWHIFWGVLLGALLAGYRPSNRLAGYVLTTPFVSVSILAWWSDNPFNALVFAVLTLSLVVIGSRCSNEGVEISAFPSLLVGVSLVAFGWAYPHFVETDEWLTYAYAAPLGLVPCPTLAAVIGMVLMFSMLRSIPWSMTLASVGLLYGAIGVGRLGATLDYGLLAGSIVPLAVAARNLPSRMAERARVAGAGRVRLAPRRFPRRTSPLRRASAVPALPSELRFRRRLVSGLQPFARWPRLQSAGRARESRGRRHPWPKPFPELSRRERVRDS